MRGVDTLHNYLPYPQAIYSLLTDLSIGGGGGVVEDGIKKDETAGERLDKHVV